MSFGADPTTVSLALASGLLAMICSVLAAMVERSSPIRLRPWAEEHSDSLARLYESTPRFEAFRFLLAGLSALSPLVPFWLLSQLFLALGSTALTAAGQAFGGVALLLLFAEVLSRRLVSRHADRALAALRPVYRLLGLLLTPMISLLAFFLSRPAPDRRAEEDDEELSDEEIEAFVDIGSREGILEPEEGELVRRVVDFGETVVRSVMTPRMEIDCAPVDSSLGDLADRFVSSGHSRLPLYDGSIDHIVGILHLRDLLRALRAGEDVPARELAKAPFFVPETKELGPLLRELQAGYQRLAVVLDEYGGTAGLVTAEDLVEEIVGELADDFDHATVAHQQLPDGSWQLDGASPVEALDELFDLDLYESPYETVGGYVFGLFGDLPKVGESIADNGLRFTVEAVEERRVSRVRVEPNPSGADAVEDAS